MMHGAENKLSKSLKRIKKPIANNLPISVMQWHLLTLGEVVYVPLTKGK